jgi:hypothetical protein
MTYADIPQRKWLECTREHPCSGCGKVGYCSRSSDGKVCACRRGVQSAYPFTQKDGLVVYLHSANGVPQSVQEKPDRPRLTKSELRAMLKRHRSDLAPSSLKRCVKGSRNGLFVPEDYEAEAIPFLPDRDSEDASPLLLLMPEGPTDLAAALDLGFRAIGRPNNAGGANQIARLLTTAPVKQDVVIVADNDETKYLADGTPYWPGIEGAVSVARQIRTACARLRFMLPPNGAKDLRDWAREGSHLLLVRAMREKGKEVTPQWLEHVRTWLARRKVKERKPPQTTAA